MLYFQHKFFANWQPNDSDSEDSEEEYTSSGEEGDSGEEDSESNSGDEVEEPNDALASQEPVRATPNGYGKGAAPVTTKGQPSETENERARS